MIKSTSKNSLEQIVTLEITEAELITIGAACEATKEQLKQQMEEARTKDIFIKIMTGFSPLDSLNSAINKIEEKRKEIVRNLKNQSA